MKYRNPKVLIVILLVGAILGIVFFLSGTDLSRITAFIMGENTHPLGFIVLFAILPILGFPIIPFFVLLGIKFGSTTGILLLFGGAALHMAVSFIVSQSFLKPLIMKLATRYHVTVPKIPEKRRVLFTFVFLVVPGLSYAMKNYILPIAGVPFRQYFTVGVLTHGSHGIPLVIAGDAVDTGGFIIPAAVLLTALGFYLVLSKIWKKQGVSLSEADR